MTLVAVDGPTGVGKSTTARAIARELGAQLVLDPVSVSPLLDDYYTGEATPAAALDAELAFLHSRADLLRKAPSDRLVVSDFSVMRTAPFAEFLDDPSDRDRVLDEMYAALATEPQLDVLVLLHAEPDQLLDRVRTRDRAAEVDLTIEHLHELRGHFATWHDRMLGQAKAAIVIDTADWDPRRKADVVDVVDQIAMRLVEC
jgi:deoxyguanosine kinase